MHLNEPVSEDFSHGWIDVLLVVHVVLKWASLLLSRQTVPIDERCMLRNALGVEEETSVLQVNPLLEDAALLEVVVEAKNFDTSWCLGVSLNRRLQVLILVTRELAYRSVIGIAQFDAFLGVFGGRCR